MADITELSDKDFKTARVNMFKDLKEYKNTWRENRNYKIKWLKLVQVKRMIPEIKILVDKISSNLDTTKEKIRKLENMALLIIQTEAQMKSHSQLYTVYFKKWH